MRWLRRVDRLRPRHGGGRGAAPLDEYKHLGVASCATGVCHGKLTPQETATSG
jgi:hypothetical protein